MKSPKYALTNIITISIILLSSNTLTSCNGAGNIPSTQNNTLLTSNESQAIDSNQLKAQLQKQDVTIKSNDIIILPQTLTLGQTQHTLTIFANQLYIPSGFTLNGGHKVVIHTNTIAPNSTGTYQIYTPKTTPIIIEQHPTDYKDIATIQSTGNLTNTLGIYTWQDFINIAESMGGNYAIESDINGNGATISPIGVLPYNTDFSGFIDGQSHILQNFTLNGNSIGGLFQSVHCTSTNAFTQINFSNIKLVNATSLLTSSFYKVNDAICNISQITASGLTLLSGANNYNNNPDFGGLIATNYGGNLNNILIDLTYYPIANIEDFGGLVGNNMGATINNAYVRIHPIQTGAQISAVIIGGVFGEVSGSESFSNIGVTGELDVAVQQGTNDGYARIGGIGGLVNNSLIINAYSDVTIKANAANSPLTAAISDGIGQSTSTILDNIYVIPHPLPTTNNCGAGTCMGSLIGILGIGLPQLYLNNDFVDKNGNSGLMIGNYPNGYFKGVQLENDTAMQNQNTYTGWDFSNTWTLANPGNSYPYPYFQFQQGI